MDLPHDWLSRGQELMKRVRKKHEGQASIHHENLFCRRYCALRTVNYGESYFLKPLQQSFLQGGQEGVAILFCSVDAPHQSDPRSDSKKRAEDRMTERRAMEKRANERKIKRANERKKKREESEREKQTRTHNKGRV